MIERLKLLNPDSLSHEITEFGTLHTFVKGDYTCFLGEYNGSEAILVSFKNDVKLNSYDGSCNEVFNYLSSLI